MPVSEYRDVRITENQLILWVLKHSLRWVTHSVVVVFIKFGSFSPFRLNSVIYKLYSIRATIAHNAHTFANRSARYPIQMSTFTFTMISTYMYIFYIDWLYRLTTKSKYIHVNATVRVYCHLCVFFWTHFLCASSKFMNIHDRDSTDKYALRMLFTRNRNEMSRMEEKYEIRWALEICRRKRKV